MKRSDLIASVGKEQKGTPHKPEGARSVPAVGEAKPRRGRRRSGEPSGREEILKAALPAFASRGYDGVDLRSLAITAKVNIALIGQTFGSKSKLWDAVVDTLVADQLALQPEVEAICFAPHTPVVRRFAHLIQWFTQMSERKPHLQMLLMQESVHPGPRLHRLVSELIVPFYLAVRPLLEEAIGTKATRVSNPQLLFFLMVNTVATHVGGRNFMGALSEMTGDNNPESIATVLTELLLTSENDNPSIHA